MLNFIDQFKTALQTGLSTTDEKILIPFKMAKRLNELEQGDHVYLTIKYLDRYENVKFTKDNDLKGGEVLVERDVDGKGRKNFPCGACVTIEWGARQMHEYICQVKGNC